MPRGQFLAYSFKSDLSMSAMLERLSASTPWKWVAGEKDDLGEYLMTRPFKGFAKYRIFSEEDHYLLDIFYSYLDAGAEEVWETQRSILLDEMLPSIGAREIRSAENIG